MHDDRHDYRKGLASFFGLMACILSFFTAPDGESFFHHFLGLFGIAPGIPMGGNSTLYIFMLVPLVLGIICVVKIVEYWHSYGVRFKDYNILLRYLPVLMLVLIFFSSNIIQPPLTDRMYFAITARRSGLRSITVDLS